MKEYDINNFDAIVEISQGDSVKYELDKETGIMQVDRILSTSMLYPCNYGFIPETLAKDGDPLDVLIFCDCEMKMTSNILLLMAILTY